jgi:energy-coupling factor transport system ATP-binding protein
LEKNVPPEARGRAVRSEASVGGETALSIKNVYFRYGRKSPDVLRGASADIRKGEFFCLLGANGAGKSTVLKAAAGVLKPYSGKVRLFAERAAMLPQNVLDVFIKNTVRADIEDALALGGAEKADIASSAASLAEELGVSALLDTHPYDLSGGEAQKCAIAKLLALRPEVLLLDEPTKAIDPAAKAMLAEIIKELTRRGVCVLAITHDTEFAAEHADRCALFFDGEILTPAPPREFFSANNFYTTAASRISRGIFENAVTADDIVRLAGKDV